ncbi:MAG TPA: DUF5916 domain-containing protein [Chitinophagaceae bacterium]|nr:DUF5916 domain-containing protein [Chitinophagaceae bacterium]
MAIRRLFLVPLMVISLYGFSQTRNLAAVKISTVPKIDGSLDEAVWALAPVAGDFIQNFPKAGEPASVRSDVKILYDNSAVYIGAMLYDDPALIRKQLTARDGEQRADVDYFSVFFDTYNDNQNGFQFLVTSANVQTDARLSANFTGDFGDYGDKTWDAVWESKTRLLDNGWSVEMRIPYFSLRFSNKQLQDWGIQFMRFTRRNNENSFWNFVDPNVNGFVNQFGDFSGIRNIEPPLRLSFSPYLSTGINVSPDGDRNKTEWLKSGGMDLKYGITEAFTLDATIIPDFGQVVSDNVVNNLTPYEIKFDENRPFFTEGTELFNKAGLFYSRRVGERPQGFDDVQRFEQSAPNYEIRENPAVTNLYNAIKLSGRTKNKLGIGFFNAIAQRELAIVRNKLSGKDSSIVTEPLANYNIIVIDQALKNRSYITFTNTNVIREGTNRDANVSAFDFSFFDKQNRYNLRGATRYSKIFGDNGYDGFSTLLRVGKVSGKIQYYLQNHIFSDKYDPNDLGILFNNNEVAYSGQLSYNQFTPKGHFLTYNYRLTSRYFWLYKPHSFRYLDAAVTGFWVFKNFWDVTLNLGTMPFGENDYFVLNTPSRYAKRPAWSYGQIEGSSDSRKKLFFSYNYLQGFFHVPEKHDYHIIELGLRYRFSNKITMSLSNRNERETDYIVFAGRELNGDPIISFVDFTDITSIYSGVYNFTPRMNLTMRVRHNWSKVLHKRFANVDARGRDIPRAFIPNQDENVNFFNLDAFFTWDFRLGSRVVVGWKNFLGNDEFVDGSLHRKYLRNLGETLDLRHGNELTLRFIYFIDYNTLKRKK